MQDQNLVEMTMVEKKNLSHNVIFIKLKSKIPLQKSRVSFFVFIHDLNKNSKNPYTPINWSKNEICFAIKVYNHDGIPDYINSRKIGESLWISNPIEKIQYNPNHKKILMICGGTGITPMLQIFKKEKMLSKFTIISSNSSCKDIILSKDIIDDKLNVFHVISKTDKNKEIDFDKFYIDETKQNVFEGRITKEMVEKIHKSSNVEKYDFVYVCGPPAFMNAVSGDKNPDKTQGEVAGILKEMGYDRTDVYKF